MVFARENVNVNVEQCCCSSKDARKGASFVDNYCVQESKAEPNFHESSSKCLCSLFHSRFKNAEGSHAVGGNEVVLRTIKIQVCPSRENVDK